MPRSLDVKLEQGEEQAVRARQADNDRRQADTDRTRLALRLIEKGGTAGVGLYQRISPIPQVLDQIDHAAGHVRELPGEG